ncbi:MAG TPA: DALR anticodon-binding domain-containing protein [Abditibacteriaceae bacterium]|nr:DALR anticodon-binding domain-containing protein [Abditibacteriaceae bacterium]
MNETAPGLAKTAPYVTRSTLRAALARAALRARAEGALTLAEETLSFRELPPFVVERAPAGRGDFASNAALVLAAAVGMPGAAVAALLGEHLQQSEVWRGARVFQVEEANGFLNFRFDDNFLGEQIARALREGARYGSGTALAGTRINVEFVSTDPTGPLPFGAGRIAATGEALCRLLEFQGAAVTREFFLNDTETSSKMRLLGESVAAFYLQAFGHGGDARPPRPEGALEDDFVRDVAASIVQREGNSYLLVPEAERAAAFAHQAREAAVAAQQRTLRDFGVRFDVWTSEEALRREGRIAAVVRKLQERGQLYVREDTLWLRSTEFGDETDRPLVRSNGEPSYLAADIAYHCFKFERGFDLLLNIWTAQHRPYVARTRAALRAAGCDANRLEVLLCENARLLRDGAFLASGRDGGHPTLEQALQDIDAATLRFWFLQRNWDDISEIDLESARRADETNPAYAARLAPARLGTMIRQLEALPATAPDPEPAAESSTASSTAWSTEERELARLVALWPDEAETAARERQPQRVARFVVEIAAVVRRLLAAETGNAEARNAESQNQESQNQESRRARLPLLRAAQITVSNALRALGIEPDEKF